MGYGHHRRVRIHRLFGCSFNTLDTTRSSVLSAKVEGLIGNHAYSVLRAVQCNGKQFVVVRNPWDESEWAGRWSDGSKEWTQEHRSAYPRVPPRALFVLFSSGFHLTTSSTFFLGHLLIGLKNSSDALSL